MIPFIRYTRPDGDISIDGIRRPDEIEDIAWSLTEKGVAFTVELIPGDIVFLTTEATSSDGDIFHTSNVLVDNDEGVPTAIDRLVNLSKEVVEDIDYDWGCGMNMEEVAMIEKYIDRVATEDERESHLASLEIVKEKIRNENRG